MRVDLLFNGLDNELSRLGDMRMIRGRAVDYEAEAEAMRFIGDRRLILEKYLTLWGDDWARLVYKWSLL